MAGIEPPYHILHPHNIPNFSKIQKPAAELFMTEQIFPANLSRSTFVRPIVYSL